MLQIDKLDHVNLRTSQLDLMIEWYSEVLGLRFGDRPDFPFAGAWMYAGESAIVHLVGVESEEAAGAGSEVALRLEHFAVSATTGRAEFEARLSALGERFQRNEIASFKLVQINVWDPDGNHIHVDFPFWDSIPIKP